MATGLAEGAGGGLSAGTAGAGPHTAAAVPTPGAPEPDGLGGQTPPRLLHHSALLLPQPAARLPAYTGYEGGKNLIKAPYYVLFSTLTPVGSASVGGVWQPHEGGGVCPWPESQDCLLAFSGFC